MEQHAALLGNFWSAGYSTVITGSFLGEDTHRALDAFRRDLPTGIAIYLVHLKASKAVRDRRRIARDKPSSRQWRERVDASYVEDGSLDQALGYTYIPIVNDSLSVDETVERIRRSVPEVFGAL